MKKVFIVTRLVKDYSFQDWHFIDNDVPGSTQIFPHLHQANILMNTISSSLFLEGWDETVFYQIQNVREWHEFRKEGRRIALVLYEEEIDL